MRMFWLALAAGIVSGAAAKGVARQGGDRPLTVGAVRFFQPSSGNTTIEGVCELRLATMVRGGEQTVQYRIEVAVSDSAGLELLRDGWERVVPGAVARTRSASAVETFRFAATPGRYRITVRAVPEGGGAVEGGLEAVAYATRPGISDLLLASAVRRPASDTSGVGPGEVRRAGLAMRTAPVPRLSATGAALTYYAELYPWPGAPSDGELRVDVLGAGGREVIGAAPRAVRIDPEGGLTRGTIDLAGLPAGEYRLRLRVRLGDSTLSAEAPFAMSGMGTDAAAATAGALGGEGFETAALERLDSLFAPLVYLLLPNERNLYQRLTVDGKRRFLSDFWRRRDPTPDTPDNPAMVEFYRTVAYVNDAFREVGGAQIPGWRTDRGRIYLRYGRPDEALRRPLATPKPYEVWRYTRGRLRHYVFYDQSGLGHYVLIATNDRSETGLPNWEMYIGSRENVEDIVRFLQQ